MDHDLTPAAQAMLEHLRDCFPDREVAVLPPAPGPIRDLIPGLHILSLALSRGRPAVCQTRSTLKP